MDQLLPAVRERCTDIQTDQELDDLRALVAPTLQAWVGGKVVVRQLEHDYLASEDR